jgi:TRAP-type C4-dicarboxylate transport system substrate-binding protein
VTLTSLSRRRALQIAVVGGSGALLMPHATLAATKWDMPAAYGAGNFISKAYMAFAADVKARTNGELDITVHPGGSLYNGSQIMRAVREGQVPIGARFLGAHSGEAAIFGLDTVPFLATDRAQAQKLYRVSKSAIEAALAERGMNLLFAPVWPPQGLFSKKPITSVSDMNGVKFRAYDASTTRLANLMGAVPTKTEASEIAQAFSTGIAESMMASGAIGVFQKIWDYAGYYYTVNAWLPKSGVIVNRKAWDALPAATRAVVSDAAAKAEAAVWSEMEVQDAGYINTMKANKMKVEAPSAELQKGLAAIGERMTQEWTASAGAAGAAVIAAYRAT